jgi:hypothetical protein
VFSPRQIGFGIAVSVVEGKSLTLAKIELSEVQLFASEIVTV